MGGRDGPPPHLLAQTTHRLPDPPPPPPAPPICGVEDPLSSGRDAVAWAIVCAHTVIPGQGASDGWARQSTPRRRIFRFRAENSPSRPNPYRPWGHPVPGLVACAACTYDPRRLTRGSTRGWMSCLRNQGPQLPGNDLLTCSPHASLHRHQRHGRGGQGSAGRQGSRNTKDPVSTDDDTPASDAGNGTATASVQSEGMCVQVWPKTAGIGFSPRVLAQMEVRITKDCAGPPAQASH